MNTITIDTPAGPLSVAGSDGAVVAAGFTADSAELAALVPPELRDGADADLDLVAESVRAYFDGDLTAIDRVPVRQRTGGEFRARAWDVLRTVPAGSPISYAEYAGRAGRPAAVRAAAQACARNAVVLFVPCHRVVRTGGALGGYRWGIHVKRWLLTHEGRVTETRS
ncbi:methylated-DNA--[protein]-cysteine S-methyltransferase [Rugosimonospora acidiphila]|uniref:Methylated-DNA--[protein]-cysteine S-methyltransferase n=1 Tax=Rugosimonospora acidiphila TaxID=556531 RepID=A0ABP9RR11_9ACTN